MVAPISHSAAQPTASNRTTEQQSAPTANSSQEQEQPTTELRRLMDLADRYAHQLVAAADAPSGVLLLVHGNDLDVVILDGPDPDVRALPRLLARSRPSSAVLVATAEGVPGRIDGGIVLVVGETSDGLRDERRFRVRRCGRTRRLTRLPGRDAGEAPPVTLRLFPSWAVPTV